MAKKKATPKVTPKEAIERLYVMAGTARTSEDEALMLDTAMNIARKYKLTIEEYENCAVLADAQLILMGYKS